MVEKEGNLPASVKTITVAWTQLKRLSMPSWHFGLGTPLLGVFLHACTHRV